jgi:hypothetical protein
MPDWPHRSNRKIEGAVGKVVWYGHSGQTLSLADRIRQIGSSQLGEGRLVVEQVELRGRAMLEEVNDAFGFRGKMRKAGKTARCARLLLEQRCQRGDPDARPAEEVAPRHFKTNAHCLVTISSIFRSKLATDA